MNVVRVVREGAGDPTAHLDAADPEAPAPTSREWLVTNGLGGYASGTASGLITRRFHGLLIAALPAPHGRTMMLNHLHERVRTEGAPDVQLAEQERPNAPPGRVERATLSELRLEAGLPVFRWEHPRFTLERRILMPHRQNTVHVTYRLLACEGRAPTLFLEPWMHFRPHEGALDAPIEGDYELRVQGGRFEVHGGNGLPPLRMLVVGDDATFVMEGKRIDDLRYRVERSRGYDARGSLVSPGDFRVPLRVGKAITFIASAEEWAVASALSPDEVLACEDGRRARLLSHASPRARGGIAAELVLAADQFLITPMGRTADTTRARASGEEVRTVIAGYHWFTDWGRDTMIALEGLTLATGRLPEAGWILRTFGHYVREGLIPNMFPEGKSGGLYHTADATLWFFHAVGRYLELSGDRGTLRALLPVLVSCAEHHLRGTRFGIGVDPADGLLRQGQEGYQLTWMDAKVGDYVVTPRRGKAVELNALFYNALRLLERWLREERGEAAAAPWGTHAARVYASFNARFWYEPGAYLYDVVDGEHGDDAAFRPNQLFAVSLTHPVLDPARWATVVEKVEERLVTPVGLRSLAADHPDYKARYFGDLYARDIAYHQGTVWAWLIGAFVDAWLKVHPGERAKARGFLVGFGPHLGEACVGSISEIFDAEAPFIARGCCAQAWSVAEVLRGLLMTAE